ncbi:hypothetical protein TNCV_4948551 [Trichonephila clavipes]|nr:hypothetical protein TNCV_4948551 [Trichonephila clavipes]
MMWFVREEFSFGVRSLRKFRIISPSLCFGDQQPASIFSFQLHPASRGKKVHREVQGCRGYPRRDNTITFKLQLQNAPVVIISTKKPIHSSMAGIVATSTDPARANRIGKKVYACYQVEMNS